MKDKTKKRILIIEDERMISRALEDTLKFEGFEIISAENGSDGLKLALAERPDLIVLDIVLPKMNGMDMLKRLKENEDCKDIPVLILSNLSGKEKIIEAFKKGVDEYMVKSDYQIQDVVDKIRELLNIKL
ncbi:MAG: response regulator [Patescibacteria group bacterium]